MHVREHFSKEVFLDLSERNGLKMLDYRIKMVKYLLLDLIIRVLIKIELIDLSGARNVYIESEWMRAIKKLIISKSGYYKIRGYVQEGRR